MAGMADNGVFGYGQRGSWLEAGRWEKTPGKTADEVARERAEERERVREAARRKRCEACVVRARRAGAEARAQADRAFDAVRRLDDELDPDSDAAIEIDYALMLVDASRRRCEEAARRTAQAAHRVAVAQCERFAAEAESEAQVCGEQSRRVQALVREVVAKQEGVA